MDIKGVTLAAVDPRGSRSRTHDGNGFDHAKKVHPRRAGEAI